MARTITVTGIQWEQIQITNVPSESSADIVVDYSAVMNDGTTQTRRWVIKVNSITPDPTTTAAQAKTALERILGYAIERMEGQEQI